MGSGSLDAAGQAVEEQLEPEPERALWVARHPLCLAVRQIFAKATRQPAGLFTPNSTGGCPACEGSGLIYTDLAFMEGVTTR
ncbi:hypothetical protein ACFXJ8_29535 [Nonomuraea sp. NPDC059194]|uniref:hypothetical protein n=1 Tax=Nonomuraea sp. NPDC059194 TaxID=3346764 RepID=UPI0036AB818F